MGALGWSGIHPIGLIFGWVLAILISLLRGDTGEVFNGYLIIY
jgi:hypothetical protein